MQRHIILVILLAAGYSTAHATVITRDITIDLAPSQITPDHLSGFVVEAWRVTIPVLPFSLSQGDTFLARVRFSNGQALELQSEDFGLQATSTRFFFGSASKASWNASGPLHFLGVDGQLLLNPLTSCGGGGGGSFYIVNCGSVNMTDSSFPIEYVKPKPRDDC